MNKPTVFSYTNCTLCPRNCQIDRTQELGFCGCQAEAKIARAALHPWEEPCISGTSGSGTVFFSGCTLRCCFCQNSRISTEGFGVAVSKEQLADIFLSLESQGAHNINLVTATQYLPTITSALDLVKHKLSIPIVYNCGGYESVDTINVMKDYVDIWLPDLKYMDSALSLRYSKASDYFKKASAAIQKMIEVTGTPQFVPISTAHTYMPNENSHPAALTEGSSSDNVKITLVTHPDVFSGIPEDPENFLMLRGVIIRHLVLPGCKDDSIRLLHWIKENLPERQYLISLMSQYTPYHKDPEHPELNRRITSYEYQKVIDTALSLGLTHGFLQQKSSAKEEYTPPFDLEGCPISDEK